MLTDYKVNYYGQVSMITLETMEVV